MLEPRLNSITHPKLMWTKKQEHEVDITLLDITINDCEFL